MPHITTKYIVVPRQPTIKNPPLSKHVIFFYNFKYSSRDFFFLFVTNKLRKTSSLKCSPVHQCIFFLNWSLMGHYKKKIVGQCQEILFYIKNYL